MRSTSIEPAPHFTAPGRAAFVRRVGPIAVLLLALAAPRLLADEVQTVSRDFQIGDARSIRIEFPAGDLTITAGGGDVVAATMTARCIEHSRSCLEKVKEIRLVSEPRGERLVLKLEGMNKTGVRRPQMDLKVTVPRSLSLTIQMGAGDLEVRGFENDVEIHLGAGDAQVVVPETAVRTVDLQIGVGDLSLRRGRDHWEGSGFISRSLRWSEGQGRSRIDVELGVGDVRVELD